MRLCKNTNCTNNCPARLRIDGKIHNLSNRKYCFDCSPFGSNNRIKLENPGGRKGDLITCCLCAKEYIFRPQAGMNTTTCIACLTRNRRIELKERMVSYKGGACSRCGYKACLRSLDFHHIDPSTKSFTVSNYSGKWETIQKELDKCVLICKNCHGELHST